MDATKLIDLVKSAAEAPSDKLPQEDMARRELVTAMRKLSARLENPIDSIMRFVFQPHQNAVIRIAVALDLFALVKEKEENGTSAEELESLTGAEHTLIVRVMRVLTAMGVFSEIGEQRYGATPISRAWTTPSLRDATKHLFDEAAFSLSMMPTFLEQTQYRNPLDRTGPFQFAFKTNSGMFDFLNERPKRLSVFNTFMEGQRLGRIPWFEYYPVESSLYEGLNSDDAVLIVDVGGGRGHDLEAFKGVFPRQRGRLVVQDLPNTINEIDYLAPGVECMRFDFFTPQPLKGARAYYFRNIFHDWPDHKCRVILQHTAEAMKKDYSRVLINDFVLSDLGSPLLAATMDINMMALLSGMERTKSHWTALLGSVGLKIVKIWGLGPETESLIEAVLE